MHEERRGKCSGYILTCSLKRGSHHRHDPGLERFRVGGPPFDHEGKVGVGPTFVVGQGMGKGFPAASTTTYPGRGCDLGGIGLKILRPQGRVSSTLTPGTTRWIATRNVPRAGQ